MCRILRAWKPQGSLEAGNDKCLEDLGSGKLNVLYSTVSGSSWEISFPAKVGSMGDAAWRKSTANYGVPAKVGPSSAHRRLTWNAGAAVAAGRPPGSGRGSVGGARLIMKKRVAARDVLAFCPQNGAAARDVLRFCRPRIPHPAAGRNSFVICGIFRSLWADNILTGAMAHEAGAVGGAPCAGPPRRSLRHFSGPVYKKEGRSTENSRFSADCGAMR